MTESRIGIAFTMRFRDLNVCRNISLARMKFIIMSIVRLLTFCMIFKLTSSEHDEPEKSSRDEQRQQARLLQISERSEQRQLAQISQLSEQIKRMESKISELEASRKSYPTVQFRNVKDRKRILITGGAGFVGSHLTDKLMAEGHEVSTVSDVT